MLIALAAVGFCWVFGCPAGNFWVKITVTVCTLCAGSFAGIEDIIEHRVNKRAHMENTRDLQNWIEVYEMFAKLYQFIPW